MDKKFCPGAANISGTPTLKVRHCPQCGGEVEIFSTDVQLPCPGCGFVVYNDIQSCIRWCAYARECVGDELYEKLTAAGSGQDETRAELPDQLQEEPKQEI